MNTPPLPNATPTAARPTATSSRRPRAVLVTGATGFLGAFVAFELCRRHGRTVLCLVRGGDEEERLLQCLKRLGIVTQRLCKWY